MSVETASLQNLTVLATQILLFQDLNVTPNLQSITSETPIATTISSLVKQHIQIFLANYPNLPPITTIKLDQALRCLTLLGSKALFDLDQRSPHFCLRPYIIEVENPAATYNSALLFLATKAQEALPYANAQLPRTVPHSHFMLFSHENEWESSSRLDFAKFATESILRNPLFANIDNLKNLLCAMFSQYTTISLPSSDSDTKTELWIHDFILTLNSHIQLEPLANVTGDLRIAALNLIGVVTQILQIKKLGDSYTQYLPTVARKPVALWHYEAASLVLQAALLEEQAQLLTPSERATLEGQTVHPSAISESYKSIHAKKCMLPASRLLTTLLTPLQPWSKENRHSLLAVFLQHYAPPPKTISVLPVPELASLTNDVIVTALAKLEYLTADKIQTLIKALCLPMQIEIHINNENPLYWIQGMLKLSQEYLANLNINNLIYFCHATLLAMHIRHCFQVADLQPLLLDTPKTPLHTIMKLEKHVFRLHIEEVARQNPTFDKLQNAPVLKQTSASSPQHNVKNFCEAFHSHPFDTKRYIFYSSAKHFTLDSRTRKSTTLTEHLLNESQNMISFFIKQEELTAHHHSSKHSSPLASSRTAQNESHSRVQPCPQTPSPQKYSAEPMANASRASVNPTSLASVAIATEATLTTTPSCEPPVICPQEGKSHPGLLALAHAAEWIEKSEHSTNKRPLKHKEDSDPYPEKYPTTKKSKTQKKPQRHKNRPTHN